MRDTALIIAAAGQGSRMGAGMNKQFIVLNDEPILVHTLKRFLAFEEIGQVIILHHSAEKSAMEALIAPLGLPFEVTYVEGGNQRQESIYNGLLALKTAISKVIIHDGARPFVTEAMIKETHLFLEKLSSEVSLAGGFFGVPLKDTVKQLTDKGFQTIDRSTLYAVQTPQIFKKAPLVVAHETAKKENFLGTDDCSLIERLGGKIEVLEGDYKNIKVTTPEDLIVAKAFLETI